MAYFLSTLVIAASLLFQPVSHRYISVVGKSRIQLIIRFFHFLVQSSGYIRYNEQDEDVMPSLNNS